MMNHIFGTVTTNQNETQTVSVHCLASSEGKGPKPKIAVSLQVIPPLVDRNQLQQHQWAEEPQEFLQAPPLVSSFGIPFPAGHERLFKGVTTA